MRPVFGLLNINKPSGAGSREVVNRVQRLIRPNKVGHAGTLDPLASGVLVLCAGPATRLISYVQQQPKSYQATFLLGRQSDTDDTDGAVQVLPEAKVPSLRAIEAALPEFVGQIQQRPPAYSAVKVNGKRAYALARKGQDVKLAARPVTVHQIQLERYDYPELQLRIRCGSGTYVRCLGRDLAASLGTVAVMSELTRTAIGCFRIEDALDPDQLDAETVREQLRPPADALVSLPQLELSARQCERLANGLAIRHPQHGYQERELAACDPRGRLRSIVAVEGPDRLRPVRNFPPQEDLSGEK